MVYRFIYGLTGGPAETVEDLTAETFSRAWKSRQRFSGSQQAATGWLLQIARNIIIDTYRRGKAHGVEIDLEEIDVVHSDASPEEQALLKEQTQTLLWLLQKLPPEQRELLVLRYILGWPVKQIAGHLGLLENTASQNIKRLLQRLREDWPE